MSHNKSVVFTSNYNCSQHSYYVGNYYHKKNNMEDNIDVTFSLKNR